MDGIIKSINLSMLAIFATLLAAKVVDTGPWGCQPIMRFLRIRVIHSFPNSAPTDVPDMLQKCHNSSDKQASSLHEIIFVAVIIHLALDIT